MASMYEANLVGKRQEILDKIFNVEAEETPCLSLLRKAGPPNALLATWVAEAYPDVASTGVLDGAAATNPGRVDRHLLQGCGQHFRQEWGVTTLTEVTNTAGTGRNEAGHQMAKAMLLLKRQMEQQILSTTECASESGATPWTMRGAFKWLLNTEQALYPVPSAIRPAAAALYAGAYASLDQDAFRTLMLTAAKAKKSTVSLIGMVGETLKTKIDDWTNIYPVASTTSQPRMQYTVAGNNVLKNFVDRLVFSAGSATLAVNYFIDRDTTSGAANTYADKNGLFLDMRMWELAYYKKPANTNLAPDGSGKKGFVDAIALLRCLNPLGQVKVEVSS